MKETMNVCNNCRAVRLGGMNDVAFVGGSLYLFFIELEIKNQNLFLMGLALFGVVFFLIVELIRLSFFDKSEK